MKAIRIIIGVLFVFAILMAVLLFIPSNGEKFEYSIERTVFKDDGTEAFGQIDVTNKNNKPAFNVSCTVYALDADGNIVGQETVKKLMVWGNSKTTFSAYVKLDEKCIEGSMDFEIDGYFFGE